MLKCFLLFIEMLGTRLVYLTKLLIHFYRDQHQYSCGQQVNEFKIQQTRQNTKSKRKLRKTPHLEQYEKPLNEKIIKEELQIKAKKLRKEINYLINQKIPIKASVKAQKLLHISKQIKQIASNTYLKQYIVDYLILICCLIEANKLQTALEILLELTIFVESSTCFLEIRGDKKFQKQLETATQIGICQQFQYSFNSSCSKLSLQKISHNQNLLAQEYKDTYFKESLINNDNQTMKCGPFKFLNIINSSNNIISALNYFAIVGGLLFRCGDYSNPELLLAKALNYTGKCFGKLSAECGTIYFVIGVYYIKIKKWEKAELVFKKSRLVFEECDVKDYDILGDIECNIAIVQRKLNKYEEAIKSLEYSIKLKEQMKIPKSIQISQIYEMKGKLELRTNRFFEAFDDLLLCFKIRQKLMPNNQKQLQKIGKQFVELQNRIINYLGEQNEQNEELDYKLQQLYNNPEFVRVYQILSQQHSEEAPVSEQYTSEISKKIDQKLSEEIIISADFIQNLRDYQLVLMKELIQQLNESPTSSMKQSEDQQNYQNPLDIIVNSKFIQALNQNQQEEFHKMNQPYFSFLVQQQNDFASQKNNL